MVKKTITFVDYEGTERTEDFWFNMSEAEALEYETSVSGGMTAMINRIITAKDIPSIITVFKELIKKTYGEKSPDGRRFIKSQELTDSFVQTEAYSELFMELASDPDKAADFVKGVLPKKYSKQDVVAISNA